jgi:sugar phosphate isomerase/epimerase
MHIRTTRRGFLGATGAAGLATLVPGPAFAVIDPTPWGIKLGLATYTFRNFDRAQTIQYIKEVQTPWISVKDVDKQLPHRASAEELKSIRKEFDEAGLKVMSVGNVDMTKAKTADDLRAIFEWAKAFGAPMMVCAPTHENIKAVESLVKEYNIRIAIHNHGPEDHNFPTPQSVLEAVHNLDPRCGLCMDVGHSARTGIDVVKTIGEAGSRLLDMHVKDLAFFKDEPGKTAKNSQVDCGDGIMPFPQIFKQLKKMNYQGCVNLEYEIHADNPMPGVQRSMSYMRGVLAGLAAA